MLCVMHRYFGGSLDLYALDGWGEYILSHEHIFIDSMTGSDVFLRLRCLDEAGDAQI